MTLTIGRRKIISKLIVDKKRIIEFYSLNKKKNYPFNLSLVLERGVYDENLNRLSKQAGGSGNYSGLMFKCSKCGKMYCSFGALKHYHFKDSKCKESVSQ